MLIAVDVGNSRIKAGVFEGADLRGVRAFDPISVGAPEELAAAMGIGPVEVEAVVVVSVHAPALEAFLAGAGRGALVLGRDLPILVPNRYRDPSEVGFDRLVNCAAAFEHAGGEAVVVDLGSAVTVDAVSGKGEFLGGAIGPGLPALRAGLRSAAPALPEWVREGAAPGLPGSTREAVSWGILHGLAGLVDRLVAKVGESVGARAPVLVTGGDAELVAGLLAGPVTVAPSLTLKGVRILYDRARRD
jgi:type III pantothenate kinase